MRRSATLLPATSAHSLPSQRKVRSSGASFRCAVAIACARPRHSANPRPPAIRAYSAARRPVPRPRLAPSALNRLRTALTRPVREKTAAVSDVDWSPLPCAGAQEQQLRSAEPQDVMYERSAC